MYEAPAAMTIQNQTLDHPENHQASRTTVDPLYHLRIKNRRQMYLERNPSYFTSPDLELADPLLYDRCIRRFQSPAEREAEGRAKGYSGVLEADLYRSEAKLAALSKDSQMQERDIDVSRDTTRTQVRYVRGPDNEILPEDPDEIPRTKEDGFERWKFEMTMRFLRGDDPDFAYKEVDESEELDYIERRDAEERWFDEEEPDLINPGGESNETGVQDF